MGQIHQDVQNNHLTKFPNEEELIKPFLSGFDITWASRKRAYNSNHSVYFLSPESYITESYGFEFEILLVISDYETMEPRTIQAAEQFLSESPAKGRVDSVNFFLVSKSSDVDNWTKTYLSSRQESRIIVTFNSQDLIQNRGDSWYIRNKLNEQFYGRDLFAYSLPLAEDTYFFGRQPIVASMLDAVKLSENRGVFGLRKTGKTSLLLKVKRVITDEKIGHTFFYDCKIPSLRKLKWNELLGEICDNISSRVKIDNLRKDYSEIGVVKTFKFIIRTLQYRNVKIVLIFDEIEYISFKSIQDEHWHSDYLDFWQTMWSCQTLYKNLVFIIAGVNPSIIEIDTINGVQNPLFGIIQPEYLKGFDHDELKTLVKTLGKRMGLKFTHEGIQHLYSQYGGHPLLSRMACSWLNKSLQIEKVNKPVTVDVQLLSNKQDERDADLTFYCKHIVSELKEFYSDEYEMLEILASGQLNDFVELSAFPEFTRHLKNYGLLSTSGKTPQISIPVVSRYVGLELARKEGRKSIYKLVEANRRTEWVEIRKDNIVRDLKLLERALKAKNKSLLFGVNSFPEGENLSSVKPVKTKDEFQNFINIMNRCFVESIENYGKSQNQNSYFWNVIKIDYPSLFHALNRIKTYRHESDHLDLTPSVSQVLIDYLKDDLEGQNPSNVKELYFHLQQRVIDGFLAGINSELNDLN